MLLLVSKYIHKLMTSSTLLYITPRLLVDCKIN